MIDLEQLAECEDFLVDARDGREIGVLDRVEPSSEGRTPSLLVSAGWFGRRRLRVDADAVVALIPTERRVIVDETQVIPVDTTTASDSGPPLPLL